MRGAGNEVAGLLCARQGDLASAGQFGNGEVFHQAEELVHLAGIARDFDGERIFANINDLGAENIAQFDDFCTRGAVDGDAQQHQFALHVVALTEIDDLDNVDQFVELLDDLIERVFLFIDDDGHAAELGVMARADIQGLNVIATAAEHASHAGQHAKLVFHEDGNGVQCHDRIKFTNERTEEMGKCRPAKGRVAFP